MESIECDVANNLYGYIYMSISPSRKMYVGKSNFYYKNKLRKTNLKNYMGSGVIVKLAIKKYGIENFKKTILDVARSKSELNEKEKEYIRLYNTTDRKIGYNISTGGVFGDTFTFNPIKDALRKIFSEKAKLRTHSFATKEKMSLIRKEYLKNNPIPSKEKSWMSKNYIVTDPAGLSIKIKCLSNFCKEKKLSYKLFMKNMNKGKIVVNLNRTKCVESVNTNGWEIKKCD